MKSQKNTKKKKKWRISFLNKNKHYLLFNNIKLNLKKYNENNTKLNFKRYNFLALNYYFSLNII